MVPMGIWVEAVHVNFIDFLIVHVLFEHGECINQLLLFQTKAATHFIQGFWHQHVWHIFYDHTAMLIFHLLMNKWWWFHNENLRGCWQILELSNKVNVLVGPIV